VHVEHGGGNENRNPAHQRQQTAEADDKRLTEFMI
jgi:hypothetical protein